MQSNILRLVSIAVLTAGLLCPPAAATPGTAETSLSDKTSIAMQEWRSRNGSTRAYLIAIHGLSLHGNVYQRLAQDLTNHSITVVAPDLRGYGANGKNKIDYAGSLTDLRKIATELHRQSPDTPIYLLGESLGASLAVQLAATEPQLISGLVLSSPGVKRHNCIPATMIPATLRMLVDGKHQLDIAPYIKKRFSNNDEIISEHFSDQTVRTKFSISAIYSTCRVVKQTMGFAKRISTNVPVLIVQGGQDRMVRPDGAVLLSKQMHGELLALPDKGHILLETSHPDAVALHAVSIWLDKQIEKNTIIARRD
jgi:acylglycerol lipase